MAAASPNPPQPSSEQLARYLEQRGEIGKPWSLQLLRLTKLRESQADLSPEDYLERLKEAHADLMRLGEFWKGRESEVFQGRYAPSPIVEPLPSSPEDR